MTHRLKKAYRDSGANTMFKASFVLIALGLWAVSPAWSDVIDVGVNGSVSGTGSVGYVLFPSGDSESSSFALAGTNNQLGSFTTSAQASFGDPVVGATDSLEDEVYQDENVVQNGNTTSVELVVVNAENPGGALGGGAPGAGLGPGFWNSNVKNDLSVSLTLTEESFVALQSFDQTPGLGISDTAELLDSMGNVVFVFSECSPCTLSLTLDAGTYQLEQILTAGAGGGSATGRAQIGDLEVGFTPVPEARWTMIMPAFWVGLLVFRRASPRRFINWKAADVGRSNRT